MKKIKTLATALLFAGVAYADPVDQQNQAQHPLSLQTFSDQGCGINESISAKAHKLANYVFERPTNEGHFLVEKNVVCAFTRINIEGEEYTLTVIDHQDNQTDSLEINPVFLRSDRKFERDILIRDQGLDGNVNFAFTRKMDETGKVNIDKEYNPFEQTGIEHKEFFQTEYQNILDKLILFYEENTSENDEWTSQYFVARTRKLKDFLVNSEKGDRMIQKSEDNTAGIVRFTHNNKGYEIGFLDSYDNHSKGPDVIIIAVHSLEEGRGRYLLLRDKATLGRVYQGETVFYKTKDGEELIPNLVLITGLHVEEKDIIQSTVYDAEDRETINEESYFQAEYDKVLDELIEFYETK
ncbi:hypothetical protein HY837_02285 [archaeon]|nr:hypothetical protein [archaeon]